MRIENSFIEIVRTTNCFEPRLSVTKNSVLLKKENGSDATRNTHRVESNEIPLLAKDLQSYALTEAAYRPTINNGSQSNFHYDGILFKV